MTLDEIIWRLQQIVFDICDNGHEEGIDGTGTPGDNIREAVLRCDIAAWWKCGNCAHWRALFFPDFPTDILIYRAIKLLPDESVRHTLKFYQGVWDYFSIIYDRIRILSIRESTSSEAEMNEKIWDLQDHIELIRQHFPALAQLVENFSSLIAQAKSVQKWEADKSQFLAKFLADKQILSDQRRLTVDAILFYHTWSPPQTI